jgi:hypothetical protein
MAVVDLGVTTNHCLALFFVRDQSPVTGSFSSEDS